MRRSAFVVLAALTMSLSIAAAAVAGGGHGNKGGNSATAKLCQHGGWQRLHRADGGSFKNAGACVSYAAHGGTLSAFELSQGTCPAGSPADAVCIFLFAVGLQPGSGLVGLATAAPGNVVLEFGPAATTPVPANGVVDGLYLTAAPCSTFSTLSVEGTTADGGTVSDEVRADAGDITC